MTTGCAAKLVCTNSPLKHSDGGYLSWRNSFLQCQHRVCIQRSCRSWVDQRGVGRLHNVFCLHTHLWRVSTIFYAAQCQDVMKKWCIVTRRQLQIGNPCLSNVDNLNCRVSVAMRLVLDLIPICWRSHPKNSTSQGIEELPFLPRVRIGLNSI